MKKAIILSFLLLGIIITSSSALGETPEGAVLRATISKYEPLPAVPGNYVTVYVKLTNIGSRDARNVILEVVPIFPFNIDEYSARKNIGIIGSQKDFVADFNIRVNDGAISGINKLKVRFTTDERIDFWTEAELDIRVEPIGSDIQITSVKTDPEQLAPGETGKLRIRVKNEAPSTMRNIKLTLNIDDTTTATYPFIPIGTTTQQRIGSLNPGESSEFVYEIRPYPDAFSQLYKIPITLTYKNNQEIEFTKSSLVGIVVNSKPEIIVTIDDVRNDGTVIFKIINKGLTDVKLLTVYLEDSDDYTLLSYSREEYIGELESDDFDTVDYKVAFKNGNATLPLKLSYRDANNNLYEETFGLSVKSVKIDNGGTGTGTIILIIVAVAIVGFVVFRVVKRKNK